MSGPTISVITVTRNLIEAGRRQSILDAMECVQNQTCRDLEHVIWDGASTDGTQDLIKGKIAEIETGGGTTPVRFHSEPDSGLYDAMNKAVDACRGEYVVFLNSDDLIAEVDSLERMQAHLAEHDPDYAFGETVYVNTDGSSFHVRRMGTKGMLRSIPFCHNSTFIRRSAFLELGGHDLQFKIVADYDMALRLLLNGYKPSAASFPISVFHRGGLSADSYRNGVEVARVWRKNYEPFVDMSRYSEEDRINWVRVGQLPLRVSWAILRANKHNVAVRNAARYSLIKTARRRLQPWRRWDNFTD